MKIAAISDLHGNLPFDNTIAEQADLIIIAGDICPDLRPIEEQGRWMDRRLRPWLESLGKPEDRILATWGNHDFAGERLLDPPDLPWTLLVDAGVEIDGEEFWLTPWVPHLARWAYSGEGDVPNVLRAEIPPSTTILVSHGPPLGYSDNTANADGHVGSETLLFRMDIIRPKLLICGHIHEGRGSYDTHYGGKVLNVSSLDRQYKPYQRRWTLIDTDNLETI